MVYLDIQFNNLTALLLRKCPNASFNFHRYLASQYSEPVLGNPYNVVFAVPNRL